MSFNKIGTPQPLQVIHNCACGNPATKTVDGVMYCDNCTPVQEKEEESKTDVEHE